MDTSAERIKLVDLTPTRASLWPGILVAGLATGTMWAAARFFNPGAFLDVVFDTWLLSGHAVFLFLAVTMIIDVCRMVEWGGYVARPRRIKRLANKTWMQASLDLARLRTYDPLTTAHPDHVRNTIRGLYHDFQDDFRLRWWFYGICAAALSWMGAVLFFCQVSILTPGTSFYGAYMVVGFTFTQATLIILGLIVLSIRVKRTLSRWRDRALRDLGVSPEDTSRKPPQPGPPKEDEQVSASSAAKKVETPKTQRIPAPEGETQPTTTARQGRPGQRPSRRVEEERPSGAEPVEVPKRDGSVAPSERKVAGRGEDRKPAEKKSALIGQSQDDMVDGILG